MPSRWMTEFETHAFRALWSDLKTELFSLEVEDQTVQTAVDELDRLKRVVSYIDSMLGAVNPELTPRSIWSNFQSQLEPCLQQVRSFKANKNVKHLVHANEHVDNLLSYLRPYEVLPQEALAGIADAAYQYVDELSERSRRFREEANTSLKTVLEDKVAVERIKSELAHHHATIVSYFGELFESDAQRKSVQSQIAELVLRSRENAKSIEELHASLAVGSPDAPSTHARIKSVETAINAAKSTIDSSLQDTQSYLKDLGAFYVKIFGKQADDDETAGGLSAELAARMDELERLESEQKTKHAALFERIESLLPGATSAGLASMYKSLRESFSAPIRQYTTFFYISLGGLVLGALVMAVQEISFSPFAIRWIEVENWDKILRALVYKAPFVAPVIWLALFSAKRRSQYERLQQEYAHKEAIAASYESFKKQLDELKIDNNQLQQQLIATAIEAISYNASGTLEGKHDDKTPAQQLLDKLSVDELKKILDSIKSIRTF